MEKKAEVKFIEISGVTLSYSMSAAITYRVYVGIYMHERQSNVPLS